jgi:hypothetical protein
LDLDPEPDPDPLVSGTDPGIRIRTKMSRIPNTGKTKKISGNHDTCVRVGAGSGAGAEINIYGSATLVAGFGSICSNCVLILKKVDIKFLVYFGLHGDQENSATC